MNTQQNEKYSAILYLMISITLFLVAGTVMYLSQSSDPGKNILTLNGPWKFIAGDDMQYAQSSYDDSGWEAMDLTAPPAAHDDDVGLSGYIPGWTAKGHLNYSGYAWYRMKVSMDSLTGNNLALAAPPAVDDAYQLFINGSLSGNAGDFSGSTPITYSIQPRMFLLPENVKKEKNTTIAFRVWMSSASLIQGAGGIHIAPTLGEKRDIEKKYRFQWEQTIKGYIVEVVLPIMFILLATTMLLLNRSRNQTQSCKWFITALVLLGLLRLNQAVYYWFQLESTHLSDIVGIVILRPLVLGSWLMAWREWFELHQYKWLPNVIATLTLIYLVVQLLTLAWISDSINHALFQTIADYTRLLFVGLMLFIVYQAILKHGWKDWMTLLAVLLVSTGIFSQEVSALHVPGIWFPYGVGVSRTQYVYAAFVLVTYIILIQKSKKLQTIKA